MLNDKNITFVNENNLLDTITADLLFAFEFEENKYVVYSKNEKDYDGNSIVYTGRIENANDKQYIRNVDKEAYNKIKGIIKEMINYNGDEYDV